MLGPSTTEFFMLPFGATFDENVGAARASADARARLEVSIEALRSPLGTAAPTFQFQFQGRPPFRVASRSAAGVHIRAWLLRLCDSNRRM